MEAWTEAVIIASNNIGTEILQQLLREHGVSSYRIADLDVDPYAVSGILKAIDSADFTIAIMADEVMNYDTIFQAGIAVGRGRPVAFLAESPNYPATLRGVAFHGFSPHAETGDLGSVARFITDFARTVT